MSADPRSVDRPPAALRAEALEELLTERGLVKTEVLDGFINRYVNDVGPLNGAKVVAKAWVDPDYRERLLADGTGAIKELGFGGPQGEHIVVVENTEEVHNLVVCTLCSCYPWPVLGCPRTGTRIRRTGPGRSGSRGRCSRRWGCHSRTTSASGCGTPARRTGTSFCRGAHSTPTA